MHLLSFHTEFERKALNPGVSVAALSLPIGNRKSWLARRMVDEAFRNFRHGVAAVDDLSNSLGLELSYAQIWCMRVE